MPSSRSSAMRPLLAISISAWVVLPNHGCRDDSTGMPDRANHRDGSDEPEGGDAVAQRDVDARSELDGAEERDAAANRPECGAVVTTPCRGDMTETECVAADGVYQEEQVPKCGCRTADWNCPCTRADQCEGYCVGEGTPDALMCAMITEGTCSQFAALWSCTCLLGPLQGIPAGTSRLRCL